MNTSALAEHARTKPSTLAFAAGGREISYADLYLGAVRQAQAFQRRGLTAGARCALLMGTSLDLVQSVFAVQLATSSCRGCENFRQPWQRAGSSVKTGL